MAYHQRPISKTYELEKLKQDCLAIQPIPLLSQFYLADITSYAVEMRYDFGFWPERDEALNAFETAVQVYTLVLAHLPEECHP